MLKKLIQNFAVKINFPPFVWVYQAYYAAVLKIIIESLKKQPGIMAIYLIAGMAAGDSVYGLSDIDLIIIIDDNKETKARVAGAYKKLSRLSPLLKGDEMGIYGIEDVRRSYGQTDLYLKYKFFTECKKRGKLLYGRDILRQFNELEGIQRNEFILGQLAFIWSLFLKNFLIGGRIQNKLMRNYICYKLTSDTCKAFISARNNQELFSRKEALEYAGQYLNGPLKIHIDKIKALSKKRFNMDVPRLLADTYDFYLRTVQAAIEQMPCIDESAAGGKEIDKEVSFDFENLDFIISDANKAKINALLALIREKYKNCIRSVLVCPFDLLHNNPLDEEHISIFIVPQGQLTLEAITEFNGIIESSLSAQHLYLYMVTRDMAISLNRLDAGQIHSALFPLQWMDISVLLYLSSPSSVLLGRPLEYDRKKKLVKNYFSERLLDWVPKHEVLVRKSISDPKFIRWPTIEFQVFFWHALRLKLLTNSGSTGKTFIPLSSRQVCRQCRKSADFNFPWLEEFHNEYQKNLNGLSSYSRAYFPQAIAALKKIYNFEFDSSELEADPLKKKMIISVVIPTFNRAKILEEALTSLAAQTRIPDEVVVVDNNSSDNTKEVVESFNHGLKIKYVLEPTQGTSTARNTGIKNASGDIIVFFDDDCVADKEWLHYLEQPFLGDPFIGVVGGEIFACRVKGTLVEDYCIADALLRVGIR
ncbi:MAG: glycosyltransferase family A protein [Candidatus Omnitrophota bacterium]|jgi:predicted nucleotidyltransferase